MDFIQFYATFFFLANIFVFVKQGRTWPHFCIFVLLELPVLGRLFYLW